MFFVIILLLWAGAHAYVIARLGSIPFIAQHVPPQILVPVVVFLGASYILARLMEHFELGRASHVLEYLGASWVGIFFVVFVCFLAADVLTGFGFLLPGLVVRIRTAALIVAAVLVGIAYIQAWRTPVVTEYEVAMGGLPMAADGTVMVVASDMHLGTMLGSRWASQRIAQFEALKPDLLILAGDIFEGEEETHAGWLPVIRRFRAPLGVFVVTGNHEFYAGPEAILKLFREGGLRVLRDEHVEVLPGLVLAGVDDVSFRKAGRHDQAIAMDQAFANRPAGATVFLSHTPVLAEHAARMGAGLMLSGKPTKGRSGPSNTWCGSRFACSPGATMSTA